MARQDARDAREGEQREGELASGRQKQAGLASDRRGKVQSERKNGRQRRLQGQEPAGVKDDGERLAHQKVEVEPGADRDEEKPEQQPFEGLNRHLDLAAKFRLGEQQARDEGAELHRKACRRAHDRRADNDEEASGEEQLRRLRRGDEVKQRPQQQSASEDQAPDGGAGGQRRSRRARRA